MVIVKNLLVPALVILSKIGTVHLIQDTRKHSHNICCFWGVQKNVSYFLDCFEVSFIPNFGTLNSEIFQHD